MQIAGHRFVLIVRPFLGVALWIMGITAAALALATRSDSILAVAAAAVLLGTFSIWPPRGSRAQWGTLLPLIAAVLPFGLISLFHLEALNEIWILLSLAAFVATIIGAVLLAADGWGSSISRSARDAIRRLKRPSRVDTGTDTESALSPLKYRVRVFGIPVISITPEAAVVDNVDHGPR